MKDVYLGLRQAGAATSFTLTQSLALLTSYSTGMPNPGNTLADDNLCLAKIHLSRRRLIFINEADTLSA
jgi:hypothetical protein